MTAELQLISRNVIHGFKFSFFLLVDWLQLKCREPFLPCDINLQLDEEKSCLMILQSARICIWSLLPRLDIEHGPHIFCPALITVELITHLATILSQLFNVAFSYFRLRHVYAYREVFFHLPRFYNSSCFYYQSINAPSNRFTLY